jgi:hypothetical protein
VKESRWIDFLTLRYFRIRTIKKVDWLSVIGWSALIHLFIFAVLSVLFKELYDKGYIAFFVVFLLWLILLSVILFQTGKYWREFYHLIAISNELNLREMEEFLRRKPISSSLKKEIFELNHDIKYLSDQLRKKDDLSEGYLLHSDLEHIAYSFKDLAQGEKYVDGSKVTSNIRNVLEKRGEIVVEKLLDDVEKFIQLRDRDQTLREHNKLVESKEKQKELKIKEAEAEKAGAEQKKAEQEKERQYLATEEVTRRKKAQELELKTQEEKNRQKQLELEIKRAEAEKEKKEKERAEVEMENRKLAAQEAEEKRKAKELEAEKRRKELELEAEKRRKELELEIKRFEAEKAKEDREKEEKEVERRKFAAKEAEEERKRRELEAKEREKGRALQLEQAEAEKAKAEKERSEQEKEKQRLAAQEAEAKKKSQEIELGLQEKRNREKEMEMEIKKAEAAKAEMEKMKELADLPFEKYLSLFADKLEMLTGKEFQGKNHSILLKFYTALKESFVRNSLVPLERLEAVSESVYGIDEAETIIDLYGEKINRVKLDESLDEEEREEKIEYWKRLRDRHISQIEGGE